MTKRSYQQNCALARASDVIGERWSLLLLRDLAIFPRRFSELQASLKGMGSNLLASRLKDLEAADLIKRRKGEHGGPEYSLTKRGRALEPALLALIRWGLSYGPKNRPGDHHQKDWDLLALKALFQPSRAAGLSVRVQFDSDDFTGWTRIADQQMTVGLGGADDADIRVAAAVADLFLGTRDPSDFLVEGDPATLKQFMSSFALRAQVEIIRPLAQIQSMIFCPVASFGRTDAGVFCESRPFGDGVNHLVNDPVRF